MDNFLTELQTTFGESRVRTNELLSQHSTLKVGGPAKYYVALDKTDDIVKSIRIAHDAHMPFVIIGTGSRTLFSDNGFQGLVIKNNTRKFDVLSRKGRIRNNKIDVDRAYVYADSGAILNQVVRFAIEQGFSGLEDVLGVSGTAGGVLYDSNTTELLSDVLYQIQAVSYDGKVQQVSDRDLSYKDSRGGMRKGQYVVLSVVFELFPENSATLWEKGTEAIEKRNRNKPENPQGYPAYSDITVAEAMRIPTPGYDRSVVYLLTKAGLPGKRVGDAMLSEQYPNYLMNLGNATGNDMIAVLEQGMETVKRKFGVSLRPLITIQK